MNRGFRSGLAVRVEEAEVAAFVGLRDFVEEE
jgi:hypothetical protein